MVTTVVLSVQFLSKVAQTQVLTMTGFQVEMVDHRKGFKELSDPVSNDMTMSHSHPLRLDLLDSLAFLFVVEHVKKHVWDCAFDGKRTHYQFVHMTHETDQHQAPLLLVRKHLAILLKIDCVTWNTCQVIMIPSPPR